MDCVLLTVLVIVGTLVGLTCLGCLCFVCIESVLHCVQKRQKTLIEERRINLI